MDILDIAEKAANTVTRNFGLSVGIASAMAGGVAALAIPNYFNQHELENMQCQVIRDGDASPSGDRLRVVGYGAETIYSARIIYTGNQESQSFLSNLFGSSTPTYVAGHAEYYSQRLNYETMETFTDILPSANIFTIKDGACSMFNPVSGKNYNIAGGVDYINAPAPYISNSTSQIPSTYAGQPQSPAGHNNRGSTGGTPTRGMTP